MPTQTEKINVIVDDKGTAKVVAKDVGRIGVAGDKSTSSVRLLGKALAALGGALVLGSSLRILRDFSQELSTVRAITKATDEQFMALRETAKELGATTRFSATQAAEAITFLGRAGFNVNQILASVDDTLLLAQAGALDLGRAADIASNVLTGFRIEAEEAGRVVDVLALAANNSNTTVGQLGEALKFVAPVAAGVGVSIEETTAAVSALSDAGLQASLAGTGLRRVLAELESPSNNTKKIFRELGVEAEEVRITQVGLTAALQRLADAGVDTGTALTIFGQRGGPAFEVLRNAIPKVESLNERLVDSEGFALGVAEVMDDNLNGALLAVRSALEAVVIAFGDLGAESFLTDFFRGLARSIRFVADNAEAAAEALGFLAAALAVSQIVAYTRALQGATLAQKAFNLVVAANPLGLFLTALAGVTAALILFQDEISVTEDGVVSLGDLLTAVWEAAKEAVGIFVDFFRENFGGVADFAADVFSDINLSVEGFLRFTARAVDVTLGIWIGLFKGIISIFSDLPAFFLNIFTQAFNAAIDITEAGINKLIDLYNSLAGLLGLDEIARTEITRLIELSEVGFTDVASNAADAFVEGFDLSPAEFALDDFLRRAREVSLERIVAEASGRTSDSTQRPDTGGGAGDTGDTTEDLLPDPTDFDKYLQQLEDEKELLMLTTLERERAAEILAVENDLKRDLTETEKELVDASLAELQLLERQAAILEEIRGPQEEFNRNVEALDALLAQGRINLEEYNQKLEELQLEEKAEEIGDFGRIAQSAFTDAGTALNDFVKNGEADFNGLVVSILEDLQQLALQLAAQELFGGAGGGLFGGLGGGAGAGAGGGAGGLLGSLLGSFIQGFQDGGRPPLDRPSIVGERGPELFVPDTAGTVVPNTQVSVAGAEVSLQNVNMLDPGIVGNFLDTPAGTKKFLNVIRNNPKEIKQLLDA